MHTRYAVEAQYEAGEGCQTAEAQIDAKDPDDACWCLTSRIQEQTCATIYDIVIVRCRPIPLEAA